MDSPSRPPEANAPVILTFPFCYITFQHRLWCEFYRLRLYRPTLGNLCGIHDYYYEYLFSLCSHPFYLYGAP